MENDCHGNFSYKFAIEPFLSLQFRAIAFLPTNSGLLQRLFGLCLADIAAQMQTK
jgi:hypothetical protein